MNIKNNILDKMINQKNIKLVRPLAWEEVFLFWYINEGTRSNWLKKVMERGYASWAEWRLTYARPFKCAQAKWGLYEIINPVEVIPEFYGGPFRTWIEKYYQGEREKTFAELASHPEIQTNETITAIMKDFPTDNYLICMKLDSKIYTIEGSHRCSALSLLKKKGLSGPEKILVAIGESDLSELPVVGQSTKN